MSSSAFPYPRHNGVMAEYLRTKILPVINFWLINSKCQVFYDPVTRENLSWVLDEVFVTLQSSSTVPDFCFKTNQPIETFPNSSPKIRVTRILKKVVSCWTKGTFQVTPRGPRKSWDGFNGSLYKRVLIPGLGYLVTSNRFNLKGELIQKRLSFAVGVTRFFRPGHGFYLDQHQPSVIFGVLSTNHRSNF